MDGNLEKECSALGGLFQCIVNDLKNGYPVWDDFAQKATKMHVQLKAAVTAVNVFLDSLQRVADLATNAKGATRDIGTALTRICMRHRSIENRLKTLTSALIDCLVLPLQEKLDDWRRSVAAMDKEHAREYKRARAEIKKRSVDSGRLQKKVRKGQNSMQRMLESAVQEVNDRYFVLLETERQAVRQALTEQRSQFCIFVSWFKPVMDGELSLLNEISQLQEVVDLLYKHSADPFTLPPASEAVIIDVKGLDSTWRFQTPPSSPGSSLGSRKSSYCSLNSAESSSQQLRAPMPRMTVRNVVPVSPRFSSISSQDSGFTSQDALYHVLRRPPSPKPVRKPVRANEQAVASDEDGSTPESFGDSQQSTPSPSPSSATWPDGGAAGAAVAQRIVRMTPPLQRPHTISAAYGGQNARRPMINTVTFVPPRPASLFKGSPKPKRSSSQDPGAQRPPLPSQQKPPDADRTTPYASAATTPVIPDFNRVQPNQVIPQPVYANLGELDQSNSKRGSAGERTVAARQTAALRQRARRPLSFASSEDTTSLLSMALDGCGGGGMFRDDDEDTIIGECVDQIDQLSCDLGRYGAGGSTRRRSFLDLFPSDTASNGDFGRVDPYCTLPRDQNARRQPPPPPTSLSLRPKGAVATPLTTSNPFGVNRRQPSCGRAPPPPLRRNSSITAATPTAPAVDVVRSRCTSPDESNYATIERRPAATPVVASGGGDSVEVEVVSIRRFEQALFSQPRLAFRASSEPPIQENAIYFPQHQPRTATSARENLLAEIRSGVRLRSTADVQRI